MRPLKSAVLVVIAAVAATALPQAIATARDSEVTSSLPEAEQLVVPDGPGDCGNIRACVYSNQDFNGTQSDWGIVGGGSGGTAWTYTSQEIRSAKNNFANRKVLLAVDSSGGSTYCIPATQNRQGPFNPTRDWIRIGQSGSTCN